MANFSFWQRWLLIVGLLIPVFGTPMAFLSGTPLFDPFNGQIDPVFWGGSAVKDNTRGFQGRIYRVWGATLRLELSVGSFDHRWIQVLQPLPPD